MNRQHQAKPIHVYPDQRPAPYFDNPNAGPKKNIDLVDELRGVFGNDAEIMFDDFIGWICPLQRHGANWWKKFRPSKPPISNIKLKT